MQRRNCRPKWALAWPTGDTLSAKANVCQFVAREVVQMDPGDIGDRADTAHALWQLHPEHSAGCWSEQVDNGIAHTARYYPRGVAFNVRRQETRERVSAPPG